MASMIGKKIGPYKIVEELGAGGMAVVYKAEQASLDRFVAIKELRHDLAGDESIAMRFEREACSIAAIAHQNIVHVYDFVTRKDAMYIIMEYVEGIDLAELLGQVERLPPEIAAIIALQAARALEYAHFHDIVHRDFKPSNLMITKRGDVKLMDFGIARDDSYVDDLTLPGQALGTPSYMSPEQIMGEKVDFRSDLFSFGVAFYQMLTGLKPFIEDDTVSVMSRILNEPYKLPRSLYPDIPGALQRIVKKCLHKDPSRRYASTDDLRMALEAFVAKKVRVNIYGRLITYLRHKGIITDEEATTYVSEDELDSTDAVSVDSGELHTKTALFWPILKLNFIALVLLVGWAVLFETTGWGEAGGAFIRVNARPWAEIYVDGERFDTTPVARPIRVTPGEHELEFRNKYFETVTRKVEIGQGEWRRVDVTLDRRKKEASP